MPDPSCRCICKLFGVPRARARDAHGIASSLLWLKRVVAV